MGFSWSIAKDARSLDFSPSACSNELLIDNRLSVSGTRLALDALIGVCGDYPQ